MKNKHQHRLLLSLFAVGASIGLSSCITDDGTRCLPKTRGISVIFSDPYLSKEPYRGLNTDEFSLVRLFIYDRDGHLVQTAELYECYIYEQYRPEVELARGEYELVAWVGTEALFYSFDHTEHIDLASLNLYIPEDHEIDFWVSHLYFGKCSFTVDSKDETVVVPMLQYSNDINYTVKGLDSERCYSFRVEDDNGKYSFKNSFLPCDRFGYHSDPLFFASDLLQSRITLLRLSDGRNPILTLIDDETGEIVYPSYPGQQNNLIELIKAAYQNKTYDFDARHIFDLSMVFDSDMKATVFIDDWEVKDSDYEILNRRNYAIRPEHIYVFKTSGTAVVDRSSGRRIGIFLYG